jgi:hypothetical protein
MANVQVTGFIPAKRLGGGPITLARRRVLTNNTTAIFLYDALKLTTAGDYLVASATNTAVANVNAGGVSYVNTSGQRVGGKYLPAATLYTSTLVDPDNASYVYVVEEPVTTLFECSIDEAIVLAGFWLNYLMVLGTGSTVTGLSGHELDATSAATTLTIPWRPREFVFAAHTDPDAADAHVLASINSGFEEPVLSAPAGTGT